MKIIRGTPGPQESFLKASSDIVIYGGSAGGGKTYALLLDAFRYAYYPNYSAVIFRREMTQIKNAGGLWDKALELYSELGGNPNWTERYIKFPAQYQIKNNSFESIPPIKDKGGKIQFAHLNEEKDRFSWQGTEIPYIAFDELTHFSFEQFTYLLSRNRNTYGFPNLIRATCNPDPDSWVKDLLEPWLDKETGFPIPEMAGKELFLVIENNKFIYRETKEELLKDNPERFPKSISFIPSKVTDNPYLAKDESYLGNLYAQDEFTREQLLNGCWKVRENKGVVFDASWFEIIENNQLPNKFIKIVRGWDFAGGTDKEVVKQVKSSNDKTRHDKTASVMIGLGDDGFIYILDCTHEQVPSAELTKYFTAQANEDGLDVIIAIPQDPGQAGLFQVKELIKHVPHHTVKWRTMSKNKLLRASAIASRAEAGMCKILRGEWNKEFLNELEKFPPEKGSPDIVDALVEAYYELSARKTLIVASGFSMG